MDALPYKVIKATVGAVIVKKSDPKKILLTRRAIEPFKDKWCLPGGHIEAMESAQEAVSREVLEETNIRINPVFLNILMKLFPNGSPQCGVDFVGMDESMDDADENFKNEEVSEMKWFDIKHATQLDLAFTHTKVVQEYLKAFHL